MNREVITKMRGTKGLYNFINVFVFLFVALLFIQEYNRAGDLFKGRDAVYLAVLIIAVVLVHVVKAGRLYLALYGSDMKSRTYLKVYCKVTPASVIFPFKLGELFRMYCYGIQIRDMLKGTIIVLLDRFMDSVALVTMILALRLLNGGSLSLFVYMLILFLLILMIAYYVFPGICEWWKKFLLSSKATEKKIALLKILETFHAIYNEVASVARGRGVMMYALSLIAWGVELGSVVLISGYTEKEDLNDIIARYLSSALSSGSSCELRQFVFCSVVLLIVTYTIIKGLDLVIERRKK